MKGRLQGRVALVTGAGNGIGRAIAEAFAREGAIVGVNDLKPEFTRGCVEAIIKAGGQAVDLPADASRRDAVHAMVSSLCQSHGRLDVMVNNAAWVRYGPIDAITEKTMDRMMAIGFAGVAWGIQSAAAAMDRGGSIINIASAAAFLGMPNALVYCGIKSGVLGLTRSAAAELGPKQIRVNAIAPGSTRTDAVAAMLTPDKVALRIAKTPLGRLGEVEDVARAAVFLACDESSFVSGTTLSVDGGQTFAFS